MKHSIYLCRHGETDWSLIGKHTGLTDIPLTQKGSDQAKALATRLQNHKFSEVWTSPLKRAHQTCFLAGFTQEKVVDDLVEWNYGKYEGQKTEDIRHEIPDWTIFRYGAKDGESIKDVEKRADRVLNSARSVQGDLVIFSHGHFSRVLAARWLGLNASDGRFFILSTAALSILGFERDQPVIQLWNDDRHLKK